MDDIQKIIFGKEERIYREYRDNSNILTDPTEPAVVIFDPNGATAFSGSPTKESTGVYYYSLTLTEASSHVEGIYQAWWSGYFGSELVTMDVPQYFRGILVPWHEHISSGIIRAIRRRVGDVDPDNYRFTNEELLYYFEDAVDEVQAEYNFGYVPTISGATISWNKTLYTNALSLFLLKTVILIMEATALDAAVEAIGVSVGDIKVDVSSALRARNDIIKRFEDRYRKLLYSVTMQNQIGFSIDTYVTGTIDNSGTETITEEGINLIGLFG